ncbi:MAG: RNA polymerase sigma factor [Rhodoglobus sp.]
MSAASDALTTLLRHEGRLVLATLVRLTGDLPLAEDAVQDATISAIDTWSLHGLPPNPRAWLILAAKRRAIDLMRRDRARSEKERAAVALAINSAPEVEPETVLREDRLRLLFICCHPSLAVESQVALSLRTICGLSVAEVARALLVSEQAMSRRLNRARAKIRDAAIAYRVPTAAELPDRVHAVATTIFALFSEGYASLSAGPVERHDIADEAVRLARSLCELMPGELEFEGLLATLLVQHSHRRARIDAEGIPILLADQDRSLWDARHSPSPNRRSSSTC